MAISSSTSVSQANGRKTIRERVEAIENETRGVASLYGITSWEKGFLVSIKSLDTLSRKQMDVLRRIEKKVADGEDEES